MGYLDDDYRRSAGVIGGAAYQRPADAGYDETGDSGPISGYGDPASGVMIPTNAPPSGETANSFQPLGAINNFFRPDSPSAQSYRTEQRNASVAVNAAPLRDSPIVPFNPTYSPLTDAAALAQRPGMITRNGNSFSGAGVDTGGPVAGTLYNNPNEAGYARQNEAARAKDEQDFNARRDRMSAGAEAASAAQDLPRAQGDARVAAFNAENARLDLAGNIGGSVYANEGAAQGAAAAANRTQNVVDQTQARINAGNAAQRAPRNYINEYVQQQQGLKEAGQAAAAGQQGQVQLASAQLDLKAKQRLDDLGGQLTQATNPKDVSRLHGQILALLGKDKPEEYTIVHAPGATHVDPATFAVTKEPDRIVVANKRTGSVEQFIAGGEKAAAGPKPSLDDFLKQAKVANPGKSVDELTKFYQQKYGQ